MELQTSPINAAERRVVDAQHLVLLLSLLMLVWSCVFAPRLLAATPADKPAAVAEKTLPKAEQGQTTQVNINTADAPTLAAALNGVGLKKAEAIITYRTEKGKFTSLEQLLDVKGIGKATLEKNRAKMTL